MTALWALLVVALLGCTESRAYNWDFSYADFRDENRAVTIHVLLLEGGCDSDVVLKEKWLGTGTTTLRTEPLAPGVYGFMGQASDAQCGLVAEGCVQVSVPEDGDVSVVLSTTTGAPICDVQLCPGGLCDGPSSPVGAGPPVMDAGPLMMDAAVLVEDAGAPEDDAGSPEDAATPEDAGAPEDSGPVEPATCDEAFGGALEYELCQSYTDACKIAVRLDGGNCAEFCASYGVACLDAFDNDTANGLACVEKQRDGCDRNRTTEICVCERF